MKPINTRFAPSPTGFAHLGNFRTAYFNWLAARASGGKFILRIDDTDLARSDDKYIQVIHDTLDWLGLDVDEVIHQSDRKQRYTDLANVLVSFGDATVLDNGAIAFKVSDKVIVDSWTDEIVGEIKITDDDLEKTDGLIMIKGDGMPTYNWATVVDDHDLDINYVIRGQDHLTNTSKQVLLYKALGAPLPKFAHVGLIYYKKKKMSKRDDAASLLSYKDNGYDPDAILNCMARLGWGPTVDDKTTSLLPKERMLELFLNDGKMKSSPANLDIQKLDSFNRKYTARKEHLARQAIG